MTRPTREKMADHARGLAVIVLDMVEGRNPRTFGEAAEMMGASLPTAARMLRALDVEIGSRVRRRGRLNPEAFPQLTKTERAIVVALAAMPGQFVCADVLCRAMGHAVAVNERQMIADHIRNIRRKGVPVINDYGRGYALDGGVPEKYAPPVACAVAARSVPVGSSLSSRGARNEPE